MVKEYYNKYEHTPSFETLEQITKAELQQESASKIVLDTLGKIKEAPSEGMDFVQEKSKKFCKQQELQKAMQSVQKIIDGGEFENYDKAEELHDLCKGDCPCQHKTGPGWYVKANAKAPLMQVQSP